MQLGRLGDGECNQATEVRFMPDDRQPLTLELAQGTECRWRIGLRFELGALLRFRPARRLRQDIRRLAGADEGAREMQVDSSKPPPHSWAARRNLRLPSG